MVQPSASLSTQNHQAQVDVVQPEPGAPDWASHSTRTADLPDLWKNSEELSDLLADAGDLETLCSTGLRFLLNRVERTGGAVVLQSPGEASPLLYTCTHLPHSLGSAAGPNAAFFSLARSALQNDDQTTQAVKNRNGKNRSQEHELAAAVRIPGLKTLQGVVLIFGETLDSGQITWLQQMVRPLGRFIKARGTGMNHLQQTHGLAVVQEVIDRLSLQTPIETIEIQVMQAACRALQAKCGALVHLDEDGSPLVTQKLIDAGGNLTVEVYPHLTASLLQTCLETRKTLRIQNPALHTLAPADAPGNLQVHSLMCTPLVVNGQILGALQVFNKAGGHFDQEDEQLFNTIACLTAQALYTARLVRRFRITNADLEASRWELLRSRNTLRALFDNLPAGLYIVNQKYEIMAINMSCARRTGKIPQELVRRPCYQALYGLDHPCPVCRVGETLESGVSTSRAERRMQPANPDDLEATDWEISTYPILEESGRPVQAIILEQDVTEKRRMEGILAQSEKLAAIGQLAASIAHEINNPLTAIIANAQLLQQECDGNEDLRESVELIVQAGARAAQVVRNLLDLARKEHLSRTPTQVNETLRRSLALMQHEIAARAIQLTFDPQPDLPVIHASQDHLLGVWLNLLLNAIDSVEGERREIKVSTRRIENTIQVTFQDTGTGIAPEKVAHIFEPFYTTKPPGRGTGLGLSVCQRIIRQHGGEITVQSTVGEGSTFTVTLPITQ
ncbi:MAG: GAF domain-containing protein [Chloroflexi bacterium]|nr:GAF domain-containing protein [Chloroflexota bacterium]